VEKTTFHFHYQEPDVDEIDDQSIGDRMETQNKYCYINTGTLELQYLPIARQPEANLSGKLTKYTAINL